MRSLLLILVAICVVRISATRSRRQHDWNDEQRRDEDEEGMRAEAEILRKLEQDTIEAAQKAAWRRQRCMLRLPKRTPEIPTATTTTTNPPVDKVWKLEQETIEAAQKAAWRRQRCMLKLPRREPPTTPAPAPAPLQYVRCRCPPRMRTPHTEHWYNTLSDTAYYISDKGYPIICEDQDGRPVNPELVSQQYIQEAEDRAARRYHPGRGQIRQTNCPMLRADYFDGRSEDEIVRYAQSVGCSHREAQSFADAVRERALLLRTQVFPPSMGNNLQIVVPEYPMLMISKTRGFVEVASEEERRIYEIEEEQLNEGDALVEAPGESVVEKNDEENQETEDGIARRHRHRRH